MDFRILGPLEVFDDGAAVAVPGARQRELLAVLLLNAGEVVSTDRLMDDLWGEHVPAAGGTALRVRVSQLRKALHVKRELLVTRAPGYALLVERDGLDLWRFEAALTEGERTLTADPQRALEALDRALAQWRGRPLADFEYAPWAQAAIVRLEELRATALELRVEAELALGHHARVVGELRALVEEHPLRERLWAQLMTALYRDGRQADALAAYRRARARLVEEVGIEPGPELQALEARILAQDPGLAAAARPTPVPARIVLAVCGLGSAPATLVQRLADQGAAEAVAVALVPGAAEIGAAAARLRAAAPAARVAAFTTSELGADVVRLAGEQDAALLVLEVAAAERLDADVALVLRATPCDVALVAGNAVPGDGALVVPFSGHPNDWAAAEVAAWLGARRVTLIGTRGTGGQRDASRLLASASLALQRGVGVQAEVVLAREGVAGVLEAAEGAAAIVTGLSERWPREGVGDARLALVRGASCPVLLVRRGLRPGALAPPEARTRFAWSAAG